MRTVLGTEPPEAPLHGVDGLQAELVLQEVVFALQLPEVVIAVFGLYAVVGQQSGLSHEEGFDLELRIAVLAHSGRVDAQGPLLEGLGVGAETEVTGQRDEEGALPIATRLLQIAFDAVHLGFEALYRQTAHPGVYGEGVDVGNDAVAGRIGFFGAQFEIIGHYLRGHDQFDLGRTLAVSGARLSVDLPHDMQNHVVVGRVGFVLVAEPVGSPFVNLDIAGPQHAVYPDFGVEEVRPGVYEIVYTGVYDFDMLPLVAGEGAAAVLLVLPDVMEYVFHLFFHVGETDKSRAFSLFGQVSLLLFFIFSAV